jgi:hypothetical protein
MGFGSGMKRLETLGSHGKFNLVFLVSNVGLNFLRHFLEIS